MMLKWIVILEIMILTALVLYAVVTDWIIMRG